MVRAIVFLAFAVIICIGAAVLQIFLSKGESKWPGLILPIIWFGLSLLLGLGQLAYTSPTARPMPAREISENGTEVISAYAVPNYAGKEAVPGFITAAVAVMFIFNIPTAVLLAIYAVCRGSYNKKRALEKMNLQDLE